MTGAKNGSLIFIVPIGIVLALGGFLFVKHRAPIESLDDLISDVGGPDSYKINQWVDSGIDYSKFSCINGQYQPVFYAAMQQNDYALDLFLKNGASPDSTDKLKGETALMQACKNVDDRAVRLLLDRKANPNLLDKRGESALVLVLDSSHQSLREGPRRYVGEEAKKELAGVPDRRDAIVRMLLDSGANPNLGKKGGAGPVFQAYDAPEVVKMLIDCGVKLDVTDDNGKTLLFVAQDKSITQKVLASGVSPNKKMNDGRTALMWGLNPEVAEALIDKGADVNARDKSGKTPMHYVAEATGDVVPKAKVLLAHGAKWDEANNKGITPFATALGSNKKELCDLLRSKGVKPLPEHTPKARGGGGGGAAL